MQHLCMRYTYPSNYPLATYSLLLATPKRPGHIFSNPTKRPRSYLICKQIAHVKGSCSSLCSSVFSFSHLYTCLGRPQVNEESTKFPHHKVPSVFRIDLPKQQSSTYSTLTTYTLLHYAEYRLFVLQPWPHARTRQLIMGKTFHNCETNQRTNHRDD